MIGQFIKLFTHLSKHLVQIPLFAVLGALDPVALQSFTQGEYEVPK
jgi:hypothetical protein